MNQGICNLHWQWGFGCCCSLQNLGLNIFASKSGMFNYAPDISALLVCHRVSWAFSLFCAFAFYFLLSEGNLR